jgi:quinol monooxygenase YgiN
MKGILNGLFEFIILLKKKIIEEIMNIVHVHVYVKPEFVEDFKLATIENAKSSIKEQGIARFDVIQDIEDPTHFILVEAYKTDDAPGKHKETLHYHIWREAVQKMMAEPRRSIKFVNIFPEDTGRS